MDPKLPSALKKRRKSKDPTSIFIQVGQEDDIEKLADEKEQEIKFLGIQLRSAKEDGKIRIILESMIEVVSSTWSTEVIGFSVAHRLTKSMGRDHLLMVVINLLTSDNRSVKYKAARLVELCLTTHNCQVYGEFIIDHSIDLANMQKDEELQQIGIGVMEHLCQDPVACKEIVRKEGLDPILKSCRSGNAEIRRRSAKTLANLAICGGQDIQRQMVHADVHEWLFTLAFSPCNIARCFACITFAFLIDNKKIEAEVEKSGTLRLVHNFVLENTPERFSKDDKTSPHGRSQNWLKRFGKLLQSQHMISQIMATFVLAKEAYIKRPQNRCKIFQEVGLVPLLKKVASSWTNAAASGLAMEALEVIGESVPEKLLPEVADWSVVDVLNWLLVIDFEHYSEGVLQNNINGEALLMITSDNLENDLGMTNGIQRRRFLNELKSLKCFAAYSTCDPQGLAMVLRTISPELTQYTYNFIQTHINMENLAILDDVILQEACQIANPLHRKKILLGIEDLHSMKLKKIESVKSVKCMQRTLVEPIPETEEMENYVFISYRRLTGSHLASLLRVYLWKAGFKVFLDVDTLQAGKFDTSLLDHLKQAKHFVLVLTEDSLHKCIGDTNNKDWVHIEIACALANHKNIVPVLDKFKRPSISELPADMQHVTSYNGVKWRHDLQDACVEKIVKFLRQPQSPNESPPVDITAMG